MLGLGLGVNRGGFVPSAFSPDDLANLEAWYKADAGITTVSSAVSVWADQSGNGRDVTQGSAANRPAYGSETLSGIDVLTFDGSDWLNAAGVSTFNFLHQGDSTVFVVAKAGNVANPSSNYMYIGSDALSSANVGYRMAYLDSSPNNDAFLIGVTAGVSGNLVAYGIDNNKIIPNTWRRVGAAIDVDLSYANRVDGFVDGVIYDATAAVGIGVSPSGGNSTYALQIGANGNNSVVFLGAMAEIVMYSRKLSVSEIGQVDNYLKAKWAL